MKKILTTIIAIGSLAGVANAGDWGKAPIAPKAPIDLGCPCYDAGFEFSGFIAGIIEDGGGNNLGGGASLGYFFSQNVGVEVSYAALNTDPSVEHLITANLVYRFVDEDACFAPYILGGGGVLTNGSTHAVWDIGAGVDIRFEDWGCVGMFADATYNWVQGNDKNDFTLVRVGFRVPF